MMSDIDKIYLPGELEALEKNIFKKFTILPERAFENDAGSVHFRIAGNVTE